MRLFKTVILHVTNLGCCPRKNTIKKLRLKKIFFEFQFLLCSTYEIEKKMNKIMTIPLLTA